MLDHSRGRNAEADEDEVEPFGGLVRYERHVPLHQVSYYLCGELQAPQYCPELFCTLRSAAETDLSYLHINSHGGDFNTGQQYWSSENATDSRSCLRTVALR